MSQPDPIDASRCPLCGEPNRCARAADPGATACWCGPETFPEDLLAQVPRDQVRRACICQECKERHRAGEGDAKTR